MPQCFLLSNDNFLLTEIKTNKRTADEPKEHIDKMTIYGAVQKKKHFRNDKLRSKYSLVKKYAEPVLFQDTTDRQYNLEKKSAWFGGPKQKVKQAKRCSGKISDFVCLTKIKRDVKLAYLDKVKL